VVREPGLALVAREPVLVRLAASAGGIFIRLAQAVRELVLVRAGFIQPSSQVRITRGAWARRQPKSTGKRCSSRDPIWRNQKSPIESRSSF
jgi:hypothetical protein